MKYIISEQQVESLKQTILNYFEDNLTPYDGWQSSSEYKKELKSSDYELFLFLVESDGSGEEDHMWYATYKNPHATIPKESSPLVALPDSRFNALEGYFGDLWKPLFIEWFKKNTGLPLKTVDNLGW